MNSEKCLVAIVLVSVVPQLLLGYVYMYRTKKVITGCFPIEAFWMHGLEMHEQNCLVICLENIYKMIQSVNS